MQNFGKTYYHHGYIWPKPYETMPTDELKKKTNVAGEHVIAVSATATKAGGLFTQNNALQKHTSKNTGETHRAFPKTPHHIAQAIAYVHFPMAQLAPTAVAKMPVEDEKAICMVCGLLIQAAEGAPRPELLVNGLVARQAPDEDKCTAYACGHKLHKSCTVTYIANAKANTKLVLQGATFLRCQGLDAEGECITKAQLSIDTLLDRANITVRTPTHTRINTGLTMAEGGRRVTEQNLEQAKKGSHDEDGIRRAACLTATQHLSSAKKGSHDEDRI